MNNGRHSRTSHSHQKRNHSINDSIGNRLVGQPHRSIDDNIGNRRVPEREQRVLHDSIGNSIERETHTQSNSFPAKNRRRVTAPVVSPRRAAEERRPSPKNNQPHNAQNASRERAAEKRTAEIKAAPAATNSPVAVAKKSLTAVSYTPESQVQRLIYLNDIFSYPLKDGVEVKLSAALKTVQALFSKISSQFECEARVFMQEQPLACFFIQERLADGATETQPHLLREHAVLFAFNYLVSRMINRDADNRIWFLVLPKSYEAVFEQALHKRVPQSNKSPRPMVADGDDVELE